MVATRAQGINKANLQYFFVLQIIPAAKHICGSVRMSVFNGRYAGECLAFDGFEQCAAAGGYV